MPGPCFYLQQHRIIPALRLKHRSGGSPRQEPPQAAVALRSASLRLGVRHGICVAKMLDNAGLRYPHRASGTKAPRTLRPLPLLRFAASATGGAHLCSIQYYLRFWLSSCRTSLAVSALRIMRYCLTARSPAAAAAPEYKSSAPRPASQTGCPRSRRASGPQRTGSQCRCARGRS